MSQDAGTLQITIAMMGADEFDSSTQQITSDLDQIQSKAEAASGSSGLSGFSDAAGKAGSSTSGLQGATGGLSTAIGALGGSLSSTIGGVMNMQDQQLKLESDHDKVARATTSVEKATNTYESTLAKYGGTADKASKSTKDLASSQDTLQKANEKVLRDEDTIAKDEENINKLRSEGKGNTTAYADAVRKLQADTGQLAIDQGKAKDAANGLNQAHMDLKDKAAPAYDLGAQKIQAAADHLRDTQATLARDIKEQQMDIAKSYLATAQTVLGAIGSISSGIGVFARLFKETKTTTDEFGNSATTVSTNWGKLIGTGGVLTLVGLGLGLIATNAFGSRTSLEQWWQSISAGNPILTAFGELIHGIAADLGLTGTGIMSGNDEITKAIHDIHDALVQTNIGKDLENLVKQFQAFLKDPFGGQPTYGITNQPDKFFAPGINAMITSVGPNAKQIGTTSNAATLGQAILNVIKDGLTWVGQNISQITAAITAAGTAILNALEKALPSMDKLGADIINGIGNYLTGKKAASDLRSPLTTLLWNVVTGADIGQAAQEQFGKIGLALLQAIFNFPKSQTAQAMGQQGNAIIQGIAGFLFDPKSWATLGTQYIGPALIAAFGGIKWTAAQITGIFSPLFDPKNWSQLFKDAGTVISKAFTFATSQVYDTFKPLFEASNWTQLFKDAQATLSKALSLAAKQVYDTFKPLFDAGNWTQLFKDAQATLSKALSLAANQVYDTFKPLFQLSNWTSLIKDAQAAIMKALTPTQIYDTIKPLFSLSNWGSAASGLIGDAQTAIKKALTILGGDVNTILDALGKESNWSTVGQAIVNALKNFLIKGVQQALQAVANTLASIPQQIGAGAAGVASALASGAAALGKLITGAALPSGPVTVNTASGSAISTNAAIGGGQITVNLVVSGQRLAQVMLPFQSGTSAFS